MDHSSCRQREFICGCIDRCTKQTSIRCDKHKDLKPDWHIEQYKCGCVVRAGYVEFGDHAEIIDCMCEKHNRIYTAPDAPTYQKLVNSIRTEESCRFHSGSSPTCQAKEPTPRYGPIFVYDERLKCYVPASP